MRSILAKACHVQRGVINCFRTAKETSFAKDNDGRGSNPSNVFVGAWQPDGYMGGGSWNDLLSSVHLY